MRMRIGIVLPIAEEDAATGVPSYAEIRAVAVAAEAAGLDSVWVFDHLLFRFDGETSGIHECWTILAAIAEATSRVELGTIVLCTGFRNAALLAKMAATLDHISGGRLILGIGAGWHDPEFEAFGYPTDHKVGRFEESLAVITDLIRDGRADLDGRFMIARDAVLLPPARPDLPILVAAKGPRMLALAASQADAWNLAWFGLPDERLARVRGELVAACERVGRDPATLTITVGVTVRYPAMAGDAPVPTSPGLSGSADDIVAGLRAHEAAGAQHIIASLEPCTPATVAAFVEAVERFRAS
jgi:alkanesulfonate monooxygenase SsuD/methylene tetrahydromethanopterin reductase-like flavin-dependent oxidoreductase (luciferase family)